MTELQRTATVVAVDFARGTVPVGCDPAFYKRMLQALTGTLNSLAECVPEGRELVDVETVVCEDGKTLMTYGFLDGNERRYAELAVNIRGLEYDRGNGLTHPDVVDNAMRWLATSRKALN
jgi:hypothetical protein